MNIWDRIPEFLIGVLEYIPVALFAIFLLYCVYCAFLLWRMRGATLDEGALFRHPRWPLHIRYPPWWTVTVKGDAVEFDSHEKDGVLRLTCLPAVSMTDDARDLVRHALDEMRVALDDPDVRPLAVNPYPGAHACGFADRVSDTPPEDRGPGWREERCYAAAWAFRGPQTIAVFQYDCSVLYGMVDGYYHDLMMPTLRLDDDVPLPAAAEPETARAGTPALAQV